MQGAGTLDASVNSIRSRVRLSETPGTWIVNDDDAAGVAPLASS
jgi:hypothetical protein